MLVRIKSLLSSGPLWVPLASGTAVRLSPGQVAHELPAVEVQDNQSVDSLVGGGMIEILPVAGAGGKRSRRAGPDAKTAGQTKPADAEPGGEGGPDE